MSCNHKIAYAVNNKAKGKIHRVTFETAQMPPEKQKVRCGWRITKSTSIVYHTTLVKWGTPCKKCFPETGPEEEDSEQQHEDIGQFA